MIVADNAHVTYKVFAGGRPVGVRGSLISQRSDVNEVHALRGVSFVASEGETIGVVGHNGSGKSTLFRAMAGLIPTTQGSIYAADRPVLLGVNAALMPELSGESNIKLGLLAMGFSSDEAAAQVDEIADFAELNEFITHPMRTYSSGMGARLRFAIASARSHSILLLDEALAVGDRRFRLKSEERIRGLREAAGLVMIVSHSAGSLKETCERGLWIHKGELRADGDIKDVVGEYTRWSKNPTSVAVGAASTVKTAAAKPGTGTAATLRTPVAGASVSTETGSHTSAASARDAARRARFLETTRKRSRRRGLRMALTGAAIVVAVGAGAAVALVTRQSDRIEIDELRTAASAVPSPSPSPSVAPALPVINAFNAQPSVLCDSFEANAEFPISWDVSGAISVVFTITGDDGIPVPVLDSQPGAAQAIAIPFSCTNETQTVTLLASNESGQQVTSAVIVSRELLPEPEEYTQPEAPIEVVPPVTEEPTPAPVDPVIPTDPTQPPIDPPVDPTPPVETPEPPVEPTPPVGPEPPDAVPDPEPGTP